MALAGPAVNVAIAVGLFILLQLAGGMESFRQSEYDKWFVLSAALSC